MTSVTAARMVVASVLGDRWYSHMKSEALHAMQWAGSLTLTITRATTRSSSMHPSGRSQMLPVRSAPNRFEQWVAVTLFVQTLSKVTGDVTVVYFGLLILHLNLLLQGRRHC